MTQKLIFLDIDGTLTIPARSTPPESALNAIRQARDKGHKVFICTGRNWGMLQPVLSCTAFDGAIGSAGGYVVCDGHVLYDHPMSMELQNRVVDTLVGVGVDYILETRDAAYSTPKAIRLMNHTNADAFDSELSRWQNASKKDLNFRSIDGYGGEPVYKVMYVSDNQASVTVVEEALKNEFAPCRQSILTRGGVIHGELINRAFDKGTGMQCICDYFHCAMADTIGFGDSMNDLAMLEAAGISVCMGNGDPALQKSSDYVCPPVDQDGLAEAFRHLELI